MKNSKGLDSHHRELNIGFCKGVLLVTNTDLGEASQVNAGLQLQFSSGLQGPFFK